MTAPVLRQPRYRLWWKLDLPHMQAWYLLENPLFCIVVRRLDPVARPGYHNHRRPFVSLILSGGYVEQRLGGKPRHRRRLNYLPSPGVFHRMLRVDPSTWTINIQGRPIPWEAHGEWVEGEGFVQIDDFIQRLLEGAV